MLTQAVRRVLDQYDGERPGVKANLARLLMQGRLGGSGRMVILPVDQGIEHGPARSFGGNPAAYDPHYLFELTIDAHLSALAAPLGLLAAGADRYAGAVPLILKANSGNSLGTDKDQAVTSTVDDALDLGCSAIGYTIYPGSPHQYDLLEHVREGIAAAKAAGLPSVVWAYPRGGDLLAEDENALDIVAYAAQIAVQLGAHIVKVKLPTERIAREENRSAYAAMDVDFTNPISRVRHVMDAAFAGRRIVVFSGGPTKDLPMLYAEARAIRAGGGHGSIVGRNSFQRPRTEAIAMLEHLTAIYKAEPDGVQE
jgi:fructose-bisphosphate aldolase, class I